MMPDKDKPAQPGVKAGQWAAETRILKAIVKMGVQAYMKEASGYESGQASMSICANRHAFPRKGGRGAHA